MARKQISAGMPQNIGHMASAESPTIELNIHPEMGAPINWPMPMEITTKRPCAWLRISGVAFRST